MNKNIILNKDANIENTKSEGEAKREDEQFGKSNQQCQKHQKVIADETKTKEKERENQGDRTAEEDKNQKNTSKTSKPETKHFELHNKNLKDRKTEHKLKQEEQAENRKQLKGDDTEKNIETSSQMNKQKEIKLRKNDERERNTGKTKPQNITEDSEKRYAWAVTNMLKQVCNVEVVIDGITTSVKEQLRRKSRNCTQRKHTTYLKRTKTQNQ